MKKRPQKFYKKKQPTDTPESKIPRKRDQLKISLSVTSPEFPKKEKKKRPQFPKISRVIPEIPYFSKLKVRLKWGIVVFLSIIGLFLNGYVIYQGAHTVAIWSSLMAKRQTLASEMDLWENITKSYPLYRDAYFESALFAYRLGDKGKEQYFLGKLLLIDPNFPLTQTLEELANLQRF